MVSKVYTGQRDCLAIIIRDAFAIICGIFVFKSFSRFILTKGRFPFFSPHFLRMKNNLVAFKRLPNLLFVCWNFTPVEKTSLFQHPQSHSGSSFWHRVTKFSNLLPNLSQCIYTTYYAFLSILNTDGHYIFSVVLYIHVSFCFISCQCSKCVAQAHSESCSSCMYSTSTFAARITSILLLCP